MRLSRIQFQRPSFACPEVNLNESLVTVVVVSLMPNVIYSRYNASGVYSDIKRISYAHIDHVRVICGSVVGVRVKNQRGTCMGMYVPRSRYRPLRECS